MKKRCCIIGSGLGALSAAIKISRLGIPVDVYEQNAQTGGKAGVLEADGFHFDTGPSILTMPFVLESLFNDLDKNINDYLSILPLSRHCKYFYPDETEISAYSNITEFAREISHKTTDSMETLKKYLLYCEGIYNFSKDLFLFNDFHELYTFKKYASFKTLLEINKLDLLRTVHSANRSFFSDKKMIQLFDRYATYNGSSPYKAPATLNIIPHVEYNLGSFIVQQGINAIPRTLTTLAQEAGVSFYTNTKVDRILRNKHKITGIEIRNTKVKYDIVVSNADTVYTYVKLLGDTMGRKIKKYLKQEPSSSALVFYWGIDSVYDKLGVHNILFSKNYKNEFESIFSNLQCPQDPTIYIYISSKYNPEHAPKGKENWFVMINAPYHTNQNWKKIRQQLRDRIISTINTYLKTDIEKNIIFEMSLTPEEIESSTGSYRGSLYGLSSNSRSTAFLRQSNRSKHIKGLYFCGGSAHPGGGIPLVLLSGKLAAKAVKKYEL